MGKVALTSLILASIVVLSSCSTPREREDAMILEGMMPKEDTVMQKDKPVDAMMKKDDAVMMKQ